MGIRTRRARKHARTHFVGFGIAGALGFVALLVVTLALSLGGVVSTWLEDLPDYTSADAYLAAEPTRVYDADGNEIVAYYLQNRRSVDLEDISPYVLKGTVDTEDKRFYQHNGVDPQGILRAAVGQLVGSDAGGGSTITQQLARNTVLVDEQFEYSLKRKVREAYIAIQMEKEYTKDQILNMYLNTIYYGNAAYGIEAASITYFDKHASELTLAEAATLVGLPNGPGLFDPFTHPDACKERRNLVLSRMLEAGDITQQEFDSASAEDVVLHPGKLTNSTSRYPYFTEYVRNLLLQDFSSDTILQGGLNVYTTLDPTCQDAAEAAARKRIDAIGDPEVGAALVSIDNSNGHIVAMVGGQKYGEDSAAGENMTNLATSQRQTGSSFKPFTLLAAMREGMSPDVMLDCSSPMFIDPTWPNLKNYNNNQYGTITLARATELSSNTAYGQVIECIGVDKLVETAKDLGIDSPIRPNLSSSLGASPCTPLEMATAYSTIASGGVHRNPVAVTKIEDRNGNVVYEHKDQPEQAIDAAIDADLIEVLEGVFKAAYTTSYAAANFNANQPIAAKTGTSDEADNLWFCGASPQLTTAVWVGKRDTNKAVYIHGKLAATTNTAQPIWTDYMNAVLADLPRGSFPEADHKATYKPNDSWHFVGTDPALNGPNRKEPEDEKGEEAEEQGHEGAEAPADPNVPTTPTVPSKPTTPTDPNVPTTPGDGNDNGGGNGGGEKPPAPQPQPQPQPSPQPTPQQ